MTGETLKHKYAPEHDPPLGGYAMLVVAHLALMGTAMTLIRRRGVELGKMGPGELVLTGVATYKLSRVISRSWIGTAIRAPFTRLPTGSPAPWSSATTWPRDPPGPSPGSWPWTPSPTRSSTCGAGW